MGILCCFAPQTGGASAPHDTDKKNARCLSEELSNSNSLLVRGPGALHSPREQEEDEVAQNALINSRSNSNTGAYSSKTLGGFLPSLGPRRNTQRVAPLLDKPSLSHPQGHDSDVLLSDQVGKDSSNRRGGYNADGAAQYGQSPAVPSIPGTASPTESFHHVLPVLSRIESRGNSSTGMQHRDMTADELKSLGFTQHSCKTTDKGKLRSQPLAVMALETLEDAMVQRGRPRNSLVPLHVNAACRSYFGIPGHIDYGKVMCKLLKRDTLLTFAIQKALRNLKRGECTPISHVTPDPAGQTSSLLGMRISPCVWKVENRSGSRGGSGIENTLVPALVIEHNVPYDPAEVVPRLMRDYAVLSHVPAILTLIDFQGKVLYQNASSLSYMGDLLRVKYDNQLSDGLLRVLFMYDLHNLDQMLEDVLAGKEWKGVIQVPGSLRRYLAASNGGEGSSSNAGPGVRGSSGRVASSIDGCEPRASTFCACGYGGGAGADLDIEFQIGTSSYQMSYTRGGPERPQKPYAMAPSATQQPYDSSSISQAADAACPANPDALQQHPYARSNGHHLPHPPPRSTTNPHFHSDSWEQMRAGGRNHSEPGEHAAHEQLAIPYQQQLFQQRKFMTLLERQGLPTPLHSRTNSRHHAGPSSSDPPSAGIASEHLPPQVGVRAPSNTSLHPSHTEHAHSSSTSRHMTHSFDEHPQGTYLAHTAAPTHITTISPTGSLEPAHTLHPLQRAGSEANTVLGSDGGGAGALSATASQHPAANGMYALEPVEEDEGVYDEMQACFHEVHAMSLLDPVLDKQVVMLVQTDVTARVELENKLADLTDAQLSMLEQLFPRHIIEYMLARVPNKGDRNLQDLANMHEQVMVLFCDVVGFTSMSKEVEPSEVMHFLNELYETFDKLVDEYDMYKLDIVGDCYIVVAGLIKEDQDGFVCVDEMDDGEVTSNAVRIMQFAKAMLRESQPVLMPHNHEPVELRIGIHTGPLVSGLVGAKMPKFTLFGDTMNTASRMETCCKPGCVHVSDAFAKLLPHEEWGSTGGVQVKGKGMMQTYHWEPDPATQQDFSTLDAAISASTLQQLSSMSGAASVRSQFTSHTTRSKYTTPRRQSSNGLQDLDNTHSSHPLLTILTNIRNGGPDEDGGSGSGGLATENSGRQGSFHGRTSSHTKRRGSGTGATLNLTSRGSAPASESDSGTSLQHRNTDTLSPLVQDQQLGQLRKESSQLTGIGIGSNSNLARRGPHSLQRSVSYRSLVTRQTSTRKRGSHEGSSLSAALAATTSCIPLGMATNNVSQGPERITGGCSEDDKSCTATGGPSDPQLEGSYRCEEDRSNHSMKRTVIPHSVHAESNTSTSSASKFNGPSTPPLRSMLKADSMNRDVLGGSRRSLGDSGGRLSMTNTVAYSLPRANTFSVRFLEARAESELTQLLEPLQQQAQQQQQQQQQRQAQPQHGQQPQQHEPQPEIPTMMLAPEERHTREEQQPSAQAEQSQPNHRLSREWPPDTSSTRNTPAAPIIMPSRHHHPEFPQQQEAIAGGQDEGYPIREESGHHPSNHEDDVLILEGGQLVPRPPPAPPPPPELMQGIGGREGCQLLASSVGDENERLVL